MLSPQHPRKTRHVLAGSSSLEQPSRSRKKAEAVDDGRDLFRLCRGERFADVLRLDPRQLIAIGLDRLRQLEQPLAAFAWRGVGQAPVDCLPPRGDRAVAVLLGALPTAPV